MWTLLHEDGMHQTSPLRCTIEANALSKGLEGASWLSLLRMLILCVIVQFCVAKHCVVCVAKHTVQFSLCNIRCSFRGKASCSRVRRRRDVYTSVTRSH